MVNRRVNANPPLNLMMEVTEYGSVGTSDIKQIYFRRDDSSHLLDSAPLNKAVQGFQESLRSRPKTPRKKGAQNDFRSQQQR